MPQSYFIIYRKIIVSKLASLKNFVSGKQITSTPNNLGADLIFPSSFYKFESCGLERTLNIGDLFLSVNRGHCWRGLSIWCCRKLTCYSCIFAQLVLYSWMNFSIENILFIFHGGLSVRLWRNRLHSTMADEIVEIGSSDDECVSI